MEEKEFDKLTCAAYGSFFLHNGDYYFTHMLFQSSYNKWLVVKFGKLDGSTEEGNRKKGKLRILGEKMYFNTFLKKWETIGMDIDQENSNSRYILIPFTKDTQICERPTTARPIFRLIFRTQ